MDVHEEYLKIFGLEVRSTLFAPEDEEYNKLKREIMTSPSQNSQEVILPFDGISLSSYREYMLYKNVQAVKKKGRQLFYIKENGDGGSTTCYAMGYYDSNSANFIVLALSHFKRCEYFTFLVNHIADHSFKKKFLNSFKIEAENVIQLIDVSYSSASLAASYILGKKSTFRSWVNEQGNTLDVYYPFYKSEDIDERESRTFPDYVYPITRIWTEVVFSLIERIRYNEDVEALKYAESSSGELPHFFYFEKEGVCKATGFLHTKDNGFVIIRGSTFQWTSSNNICLSSYDTLRVEFIKKSCVDIGGRYVVTEDTLCKSASTAAAILCGQSLTYLCWKDKEGKTLKDIYPQKFYFYSSSSSLSSKVKIREGLKVSLHFFYIRNYSDDTYYCDAVGYYDVKNNKFIVKKDSCFAVDVPLSFKYTSSWQLRRLFLNKECRKEECGYILKRDYMFKTPTLAATYVLGKEADGLNAWRDENNCTLSDMFPILACK